MVNSKKAGEWVNFRGIRYWKKSSVTLKSISNILIDLTYDDGATETVELTFEQFERLEKEMPGGNR